MKPCAEDWTKMFCTFSVESEGDYYYYYTLSTCGKVPPQFEVWDFIFKKSSETSKAINFWWIISSQVKHHWDLFWWMNEFMSHHFIIIFPRCRSSLLCFILHIIHCNTRFASCEQSIEDRSLGGDDQFKILTDENPDIIETLETFVLVYNNYWS